MPILRQGDARVGCLAMPISVVAGFIVTALVAAAVGADAGTSTVVGLVGAVVAVILAWRALGSGGVLGR